MCADSSGGCAAEQSALFLPALLAVKQGGDAQKDGAEEKGASLLPPPPAERLDLSDAAEFCQLKPGRKLRLVPPSPPPGCVWIQGFRSGEVI